MKPEDNVFKNIAPDFLFSKPQEEVVDFVEHDLIELKPFGMSLQNDTTRPFLLLKDASGHFTLPVGINQIEAGVTLTQSSMSLSDVTPHRFSARLLGSLDIRIDKCIFVEIKGLHQYVRIYMTGHPKFQSLKFKAEDAMSLCLHLKVPIFASRSFIESSKVMTAEISSSAKNILHPSDPQNLRRQTH